MKDLFILNLKKFTDFDICRLKWFGFVVKFNRFHGLNSYWILMDITLNYEVVRWFRLWSHGCWACLGWIPNSCIYTKKKLVEETSLLFFSRVMHFSSFSSSLSSEEVEHSRVFLESKWCWDTISSSLLEFYWNNKNFDLQYCDWISVFVLWKVAKYAYLLWLCGLKSMRD